MKELLAARKTILKDFDSYVAGTINVHRNGVLSIVLDKTINKAGYTFMKKENGKYRYAFKYIKKYDKDIL